MTGFHGEFYSYDEYIEVPGFVPEGVVLAIDGGGWVGMSATSKHPAECFTEMTGVLAPCRRRGLSLALKLPAIGFVRASGHQWLRTFHHPRNTAAIGMNRRLGFVEAEMRKPGTP
ncbi:hypothetical protein [Amycolatopsis sp. NBC_01480]|uniref:hypothetical protein n=1 Tax=Amycolatopsis sp. NBC_01480 TaxID=2903562 RepID=UPI002E2C98DC|nr:hypothetical protein [Amycolatopsis sp. NBC_01480]